MSQPGWTLKVKTNRSGQGPALRERSKARPGLSPSPRRRLEAVPDEGSSLALAMAVSLGPRQIGGISKRAAEVKRYAKSIPGNVHVRDLCSLRGGDRRGRPR